MEEKKRNALEMKEKRKEFFNVFFLLREIYCSETQSFSFYLSYIRFHKAKSEQKM